MLLIGAGQLTEYLATMALFCGFAVTVCDPREEYRGNWPVAGVKLEPGMPDDVVTAFNVDRRTCVIALTHDPKLDDLALLEALGSEAFYVGAIGSRRNNEARRARMIEHFEQTEDSLANMRGPDRHLHRQQDPTRNRGERDGRSPGTEKRRSPAARHAGGPSQGAPLARRVAVQRCALRQTAAPEPRSKTQPKPP